MIHRHAIHCWVKFNGQAKTCVCATFFLCFTAFRHLRLHYPYGWKSLTRRGSAWKARTV